MVGAPERMSGMVPCRTTHVAQRDQAHLPAGGPTGGSGGGARGRARVGARPPGRQSEAIRRDRTIPAFEGDTVGSALAAAGVTITSRSFKYHRPRGLQCMTGSCPNCLMQIDGIPNVRACTEPVREGMRVERQNAWPSVDRDIHGWLDTFSFMMPQ